MALPWVKQVNAASKELKKALAAGTKKQVSPEAVKKLRAEKLAKISRKRYGSGSSSTKGKAAAPETVATVTVPTA